MLPSGRSVGEQIFACDEGVMGLHNDRRTGGNMPANDRQKVIQIASSYTTLSATFIIKQALRITAFLTIHSERPCICRWMSGNCLSNVLTV